MIASKVKYAPASNTEKRTRSCSCQLTVIILTLLIICVILSVLVAIFALRDECYSVGTLANMSDSHNIKVCLTKSCVEVAALYLANMDLAVDPCEDFFEFACGGFIQKNPLGEKDLIKDLGLNHIPSKTDAKLIKLLEGPHHELYNKTSTAIRKMKYLYGSCRNSTSNQRNGPKILQEQIRVLGGWSLSGIRRENMSLEERTFLVHRSYSEGLFKSWIVANPLNNTYYQLRFQPSCATYPIAALYKSGEKSRSRLANYINAVVSILGGVTDSPLTRRRIWEIVNIEQTLLEMTPPDSFRDDVLKTNKVMELKELQELIGSKFQLTTYMTGLLGRPVTPEYPVLVESVNYMTGLRDILNNYTETAVADYLVWTWIHSRMQYLSKPFTTALERFTWRRLIYGGDTCLQMTKTYFSQALGALYVQDFYKKESDPEVHDMMLRLRKAFSENLENVSWMNNTTKQHTKGKVDSMKQVVAYLDINTDADKLDAKYVYTGDVAPDNFFMNIDNLKKSYYAHQISLLGKKQTIVDAISELQAPYDAGATYAPHQNTIIVWAGLLQYAFFDHRFPVAAKFGSLGFVVGHEVTHAFDNDGKNYNKYGNYQQWWDNETIARFDERAKCFVDQYSKYQPTDGKNIDGNTTLGENIADNGGVKIAFYAYKSWLENNESFELGAHLPGLNLTAEQLFFIAMATPLCTVEADILSIYNIKNDVHSQARYRIIGALSNFNKFAEAYSCKPGSRMNPERKCAIW